MTLFFNDKGFLSPPGFIQCDWNLFKNTFASIENPQGRRAKIFQNYQDYIEDLRTILGDIPFIHWVNGSFVTKKQNPNDIDVISFLPKDDYIKLDQALTSLRQPKVSLNYNGYIDAYILPREQSHLSQWESEFSRVKGRNKITIPGVKKGFLQITF